MCDKSLLRNKYVLSFLEYSQHTSECIICIPYWKLEPPWPHSNSGIDPEPPVHYCSTKHNSKVT